MERESAESESHVSGDPDSFDELRDRIDRLEETLDALATGDGWRPMRSRCTHCRQGRLVRRGMTVRCSACGYESG